MSLFELGDSTGIESLKELCDNVLKPKITNILGDTLPLMGDIRI